MRYGEGLAKVQLVTEDGKRMIGVGHDVLSIHILRPYQRTLDSGNVGWDEFYSRIKRAIEAYWKVSKPIGVTRIGIRYINKIVIPQIKVRVEDYLKCALPNVSGLPDQLSNFMSRVEYTYGDNVRLVLSQGSIEAPPDNVGFLLDLDVIWHGADPISEDEALTIISDLREREREAFEIIITEKAREHFDATD